MTFLLAAAKRENENNQFNQRGKQRKDARMAELAASQPQSQMPFEPDLLAKQEQKCTAFVQAWVDQRITIPQMLSMKGVLSVIVFAW
jgi:hypothetical protein